MDDDCTLTHRPPHGRDRCISKREGRLFYTHWSVFALLIVVALTFLYTILTRTLKKTSQALDYILLPICIAGVSNSIGICLAAEYLICYKIKDVHIYGPVIDDATVVTLAQTVMSKNFMYHTIPLYVALSCIGILYMSRHDCAIDPVALIVLAILWVCVLQGMYLATPFNGRIGLNKVLDAYTTVDPWTYAILIGLTIATATVLAFTLPTTNN